MPWGSPGAVAIRPAVSSPPSEKPNARPLRRSERSVSRRASRPMGRDVAGRESRTARRVSHPVGVPPLVIAEQVALVAERQPAGIEAEGELPQLAARTRIPDRQVEMDRRRRKRRQAGGIDPEGPRVADVGGEEIASGRVRGDLGERARSEEQEWQGQSDRPTVPRSGHYGSTATVV